MRIAIHTPVGSFVSRILSVQEVNAVEENFNSEYANVQMEGQGGQEFTIPRAVLNESVLECIHDEAIAALPKLKG